MKTKLLSGVMLAIAMACVGTTVATDAMALPRNGYQKLYYQNAGLTGLVVGTETLTCSGTHTLYGYTTPYFSYEVIDCHNPD